MTRACGMGNAAGTHLPSRSDVNLNIHLASELAHFATENKAGCGRPAARVRT
jgi:hypothetical protein